MVLPKKYFLQNEPKVVQCLPRILKKQTQFKANFPVLRSLGEGGLAKEEPSKRTPTLPRSAAVSQTSRSYRYNPECAQLTITTDRTIERLDN
jgi:hypothetical protein